MSRDDLPPLTLVSHALCPYVQRAAIVLTEKSLPFERHEVDLADKPDWFLRISPLGKTPVLMVGEEPVFESAVICEYLDEIAAPRLHPVDALQRAQHRAWMAFGSAVLDGIGAFYNAPDEATLAARASDLRVQFERLDEALGAGPWFGGVRFGLVDAVFAPVFRYFDVIDCIGDFGLWGGLPKLQAWRRALAARPSVQQAARVDYPERLARFIERRGSALSLRLRERPVAL